MYANITIKISHNYILSLMLWLTFLNCNQHGWMNQHPHLNHNWSHGISSCYANAFFYHRIAMHFLKLGEFPPIQVFNRERYQKRIKKKKKEIKRKRNKHKWQKERLNDMFPTQRDNHLVYKSYSIQLYSHFVTSIWFHRSLA